MIDINCDVGEGLNNEHLLMPYISSCNIACGGHAGDKKTMAHVVSLASKYNVKIGAHPSYPDKENFGRKSIQISNEDLKESILNQVNSLEEVMNRFNVKLHHIKPHGALYNDLANDQFLALRFLKIIDKYKVTCFLYAPYGSAIAKEAKKNSFNIIYEVFADRNYNEDLSLVSRQHTSAILTHIDDIT